MSEEKKKKTYSRPRHDGSVVEENRAFTEWLNRLWARGEPPERLELWQVFGINKLAMGEMIFHDDFNAEDKTLDIEQVNKIANEIYEAAQEDTNSSGRRRAGYYMLKIKDRNRGATPLTKRIGPIMPKSGMALATGDETDTDDEDPKDIRSLEVARVKSSFDEARWDKDRYDKVMGQMLILQNNIISNQQTWIDKLFNGYVTMFDKMQEAQDRRAERDVYLEKEKFKISLMKEGIRTARNLLPGLFAGAKEGNEGENGNGRQLDHIAEDKPNGSNGTNQPRDYGPSPERSLVDNFLHDIEEMGDEIHVKLFGDYKEEAEKLVLVTPGVFTARQYATLEGVRAGRYPVERLDNLMPGSGHLDAITQAQVEKAGDAGVTEGMGMAIMELMGLRSRAKQLRETVTAPSTDENDTQT